MSSPEIGLQKSKQISGRYNPLYDLTNTYFEGEKKGSSLARFARSKEKRSDERLVVLALVVNGEEFIKYSDVFEGNMTDSDSLPGIITGYGYEPRRVSVELLWC